MLIELQSETSAKTEREIYVQTGHSWFQNI
jgi:hypothetical protein